MKPSSDFWPPELQENTAALLFEASKFLVLCYSRNGELTQSRNRPRVSQVANSHILHTLSHTGTHASEGWNQWVKFSWRSYTVLTLLTSHSLLQSPLIHDFAFCDFSYLRSSVVQKHWVEYSKKKQFISFKSHTVLSSFAPPGMCIIPCPVRPARCCSVAQSCLNSFVTPWSPPGSFVHGILRTRILEWVATSYSRSPWPTDRTRVSCVGRQILYHWATREAQ